MAKSNHIAAPEYRRDHVCPSCSREFMARSPASKTCSPECRFIAYENRSEGCWNWLGPKNTQGYGRLFLDTSRNGRRLSMFAHRYALERTGIAIPDGMLVMHRCDNPGCVNPAHLLIGTWADNNRDRAEKGRTVSVKSERRLRVMREQYKGEGNPSSKLSADQVMAIRSDPRGSTTVARSYGVSKATVQRIRNRVIWGWLD